MGVQMCACFGTTWANADALEGWSDVRDKLWQELVLRKEEDCEWCVSQGLWSIDAHVWDGRRTETMR